ncbi:MAG: FHA domain-containing protein [Bacteriovoracia bacterium]
MKEAAIFKYDETSGQEVLLTPVKEQASIGKSDSAHVCLDDWRCNGIHALIKKEIDGKLLLIDLGSYFGTYVNNQKIIIHY